MKQIFAVLEAVNLGADTTLRALPTARDDEQTSDRYSKEKIETFDTREEAIERARELVRENPTQTYHAVETVKALHTDMPIIETGFGEAP